MWLGRDVSSGFEREGEIPMLGTTENSVREVAFGYLMERYPALAEGDVAMIPLESGWLVETVPAYAPDDGTAYKVMLIVDHYGGVQEIGTALPRQSAHRCLADINTAIEVVNLNEQEKVPSRSGW